MHLHDLVQGPSTSTALYVYDEDKDITYKQLHDAVSTLRQVLTPFKDRCIIIAHRSTVVTIASLMACSSVGAFFHCCDEVESEYRKSIIARLNAACVIVDETTEEGNAVRLTVLNETVVVRDLSGEEDNCVSMKETGRAYAMTTSGTTGTPKLVIVEHNNAARNIISFVERLCLKTRAQPAKTLHSAPLTFDPSLVEIFATLHVGGTLYTSADWRQVAARGREFLRRQHNAPIDALMSCGNRSSLQCTPTQFDAIVNDTSTRLPNLKLLALGGENFPMNAILRAVQSEQIPDNCLFANVYGVTEMSIWASVFVCDLHRLRNYSTRVPIGESLADTQVTLERGHITLHSATRACLISVNSCDFVRQSIVDTGDIGEEESGQLYCIGRRDMQIKRRGCRMNLESVEERLCTVSGIDKCALVYDIEAGILTACIVRSKKRQAIGDWKTQLATHEMPDHWYTFEELPMSSHGKLDRRILQELVKKKRCNATGIRDVLTLFLPCDSVHFDSLQIMTLHEHLIEHNIAPVSLVNLYEALYRQTLNVDGLYSRVERLLRYQTRERSSEEEEPTQKRLKAEEHAFNGDSAPKELIGSAVLAFTKCVDSTPVVTKRDEAIVVYCAAHSGVVAAATSSDNGQAWTECWRTNVGARIEADVALDPKTSAPVIGCYDGNLYFLNALNGATQWQCNVEDIVKAPVVFDNEETARCFVGSHAQKLYCVMVQKGIEWSVLVDGAIVTPAVLHANSVICATLRGVVRAFDKSNGEVLWQQRLMAPVFAPMRLMSESVLLICTVDGTVHVVNVEQGEKISTSTCSMASIFTAPVLFEDKTFLCFDQDATMHQFELIASGILKHSKSTKVPGAIKIVRAPLVIEESRLYVVDAAGALLSYEMKDVRGVVKSLRLIGKCNFASQTFTRPVLVQTNNSESHAQNPVILVGCRDEKLHSVIIE